jgi:hypothetical protein
MGVVVEYAVARMVRSVLVLGLLAGIVISSGASEAAGAPPHDDTRWMMRHAFEALGAAPRPCPEPIESKTTPDQELFCAEVDLGFAEFKKAWRRAIKSTDRFAVSPDGGWKTPEADWRLRRYTFNRNHPMTVVFHETGHLVGLEFGRQLGVCDPSSGAEEILDSIAHADDLVLPVLDGANVEMSMIVFVSWR